MIFLNFDIDSLKRAFEKAKRNNIVVFLFFLFISCCLWFSLTLNRMYETDIPVSVRVKNVPSGVELEDDVATRVVVRGEGTDLFGYMFGDGIDVSADYSEFHRNRGRLTMPTNLIKGRIVAQLDPSLSLTSVLGDTLTAAVKRASAVVPVKRGRLDLGAADGCEVVSVRIEPEEVRVAALVDEVNDIREVRTAPYTCDGLGRDTLLELALLPGKYIDVKPALVRARVRVSRYVKNVVSVPVEYVKFPADIDLGFMPQSVEVEYEVLEINRSRVKASDFSVKLFFDDYAKCVMSGRPGDLERRFVVSSSPSRVRKPRVVGVELTDTPSLNEFVEL